MRGIGKDDHKIVSIGQEFDGGIGDVTSNRGSGYALEVRVMKKATEERLEREVEQNW